VGNDKSSGLDSKQPVGNLESLPAAGDLLTFLDFIDLQPAERTLSQLGGKSSKRIRSQSWPGMRLQSKQNLPSETVPAWEVSIPSCLSRRRGVA